MADFRIAGSEWFKPRKVSDSKTDYRLGSVTGNRLQPYGKVEVDRLADYNRYLNNILRETHKDHPDWNNLKKLVQKSEQLAKKCEPELNPLDRIQDLFPNDALYLHYGDAVTLKMKGLNRKQSTLQRAFSSSSKTAAAAALAAARTTGQDSAALPKMAAELNSNMAQKKRQFIMEAAVTFTMGLQCQERHLFLFNDLLLIAKPRSGGNFKLKEKVLLCELWLSRSMEQVCEVAKSPEVSFVIGWPTVNVVVTFSSLATRDLWWDKLDHVTAEERRKQVRSTNIQVTFNDTLTGIEYLKTLSVTAEDTAKDCIRMALSHLELSDADADHFRLWVKTTNDDAPYPLIGHENPFAIKMHYIRRFSAEDPHPSRIDHCNNISSKCQFILK